MLLVSELPIFQSDAQFQHERVFSSLHLLQLFDTRDKLTFGVENVFAYACHDHADDRATDGDDSNAMFSRYDTTPLENIEKGLSEYEKGQDCGVVNHVRLQATHLFALQFLSFCYILHHVSHVADTNIWKIHLSRAGDPKIKVDGISRSDVFAGVEFQPKRNASHVFVWKQQSLVFFSKHVVIQTVEGLNEKGLQHPRISVVFVLHSRSNEVGVEQDKSSVFCQIHSERERVRSLDRVWLENSAHTQHQSEGSVSASSDHDHSTQHPEDYNW